VKRTALLSRWDVTPPLRFRVSHAEEIQAPGFCPGLRALSDAVENPVQSAALFSSVLAVRPMQLFVMRAPAPFQALPEGTAVVHFSDLK
jgi:hypothetical protein